MAETELLEPPQTDAPAPTEEAATAEFVAVPVPTLPAESIEASAAAPPEAENEPGDTQQLAMPDAVEEGVGHPRQGGRISRLLRAIGACFARSRSAEAPPAVRTPMLARVGGMLYSTVDTLLATLNAPFVRLKTGMRSTIGGTAVATLALSAAAVALQPFIPPRDAFSFPREQRLLLEKKQAEEKAASEAAKSGHAEPAQKDGDGHGKPAAGGHSPPAGHGESATGSKKKEKPPKSGNHGAASGPHAAQDAGHDGKSDPHAAKTDSHGGASPKPAAKPAKSKPPKKKAAKSPDPHAAPAGH